MPVGGSDCASMPKSLYGIVQTSGDEAAYTFIARPVNFPPTGRLSLMRTLTPGAWYLLFTCKGCHQKQVLFRDLSEGETNITATYNIACAECSHRNSYECSEIERYYSPLEIKQAMASA